jgi:tetratricopeptide (TPR) repeat protein
VYHLHLAEALTFLALEKKDNWEDYSTERAEAGSIAKNEESSCSDFEPFIRRIRALISSPLFLAITSSRDAIQAGSAGDMTKRATDIRMSAEDIRRAVELDPSDAMNWLVLWKVLPFEGQGDSVLRAAQLDSSSPLIQYELGKYQLARGKYADARNAFDEALRLNASHYRSVIGLAFSIASADPDAEVESYYKKAREIAPEYLEAGDLLGNYYVGIEEVDQGIDQFNQEVKTNPAYFPAFLSLGLTYLHASRIQEAEAALRKTIELDPTNPEAHCYLGTLRLNMEDLDTAKQLFSDALNYRVNFADAYYGLGLIAYRQHRTAEAVEKFDQAIKNNAQYAEAYVARAAALPKERSRDAVKDLERAIELYEHQSAKLQHDAEISESKGLSRKASAERNRISGIQNQILNARNMLTTLGS